MKAINNAISSFLTWRLRHLSHRHFVLILSVLVGLFVGGFSVGVKLAVFEFYHLVRDLKTASNIFILFFFPLIGLLLTYGVSRFIFKDKIGHGVTNVLFNISKQSSLLKKRLFLSRIITAIITVGFGGSVGLEAPMIVTGSSFGSNFGKILHLHYKTRTLLIGCGSAAAIAGIFNSPIAGVIFVLEVIYSEIKIEKFIPILISSVCASLISKFFQDHALFNFVLEEKFIFSDLPYYISLGIFCGFIAVYFNRIHFWIEGKLGDVKNDLFRILIGGGILSLIILLFPSMYGEGYEIIRELISGHKELLETHHFVFPGLSGNSSIIVTLCIIILLKAVASACTVGSGGSGGIFAPSLFLGGLSGFLITKLSGVLGLNSSLSTSNFTLVGMCGVLTGVLHAPLTGIFLIAEITGGYTLILPLMLVSALSYVTTRLFESNSIYTKHLIEQGHLIKDNKDKEILSLIQKKKLIERGEPVLLETDPIHKLIEILKISDKIKFAVLDEKSRLKGVINWEDVKTSIFNKETNSELTVGTIMHNAKTIIKDQDSTNEIMSKFEKSGSWCLPAISSNGIYLGFIYKETLFKFYRERLIKQDQQEL